MRPLNRSAATLILALIGSVCFPARVSAVVPFEYERMPYLTQMPVASSDQTGTFSYSYPLTLPPGRNGLQPDLALLYNSRESENANILGYGWSLSLPEIRRINRTGVENLYGAYLFSSSFDGELAPNGATTTESYGAKVDTGDFRKYEYINHEYWRVTDKRGTVYTFGSSTASRQDNPSASTTVFRWMLDEVRDLNGNYISYAYTKDKGQIYPLRITYTGNGATAGIFDVEFTLASRTDNASSTASGFGVRSDWRVSEIKTEVNNTWARKYALGYSVGDNGARSVLSSITETGQGEDASTIALPATSFTYETAGSGWATSTAYVVPADFITSSGGYTGLNVLDANADGLLDLVHAANNQRYVFLNTGNDTGWATSTAYTFPVDFVNAQGDTGVRILDVNGDGFADFITGRQGDTNEVYIHNGTSGWVSNTNYTGFPLFVTSTGGDLGVRIGDVNGDGLPDFIKSVDDTHTVYMNDGDGTGWTQRSGYTGIPNFVESGAEKGIRVVDVNGDGLDDIVKAVDGSRNVYINNGDGTGWTENLSYSVPVAFTLSGNDNETRLGDINGDGLLDIIYSGGSGNVYLNDGDHTGWTTDPAYSVPLDFIDDGSSVQDQGVRFFDANGDGLPDLVQAKDTTRGVYLNNGKPADLLTRIVSSRGATTTVAYKTSAQQKNGSTLLNPRLSLALTVVDTITTEDSLGEGTRETRTYGGGLFRFGTPFDREFAGFATSTVTDGLGFVTKTYFHQGTTTMNSSLGKYDDTHIAKKNKPYRVETYDAASNLSHQTLSRIDRADLGNSRSFVKKTRVLDMRYDGDADHRDSAVEYDYATTTGNLTQKTEYGEVTATDAGSFTDSGTDKFTTAITYAASTTLHLVGLPSQETVTDYSTTTVKDTKHYYDSLALGSVAKGNETTTEFLKSGSTYLDTERTFNSYGLVTEEKDPRDKATTLVYDAYNLHLATSTNPAGHVTEYYRDFSSGKAKKTTDPNGLSSETVFDALDRPITEKQPDLTTPATLATTTTFAYTDSVGSRRVAQAAHLSAATSTDTYTYLDGFDRPVQERVEAESGNYTVRDFVYAKNGILRRESLPYFSSSTPRTASTTLWKLYTTHTFDPLDRDRGRHHDPGV